MYGEIEFILEMLEGVTQSQVDKSVLPGLQLCRMRKTFDRNWSVWYWCRSLRTPLFNVCDEFSSVDVQHPSLLSQKLESYRTLQPHSRIVRVGDRRDGIIAKG